MKLFLEVIVVCYAMGWARPNQTFEYEKLHNFGIGRRPIPNFRRMQGYAAPQPLPPTKVPDHALFRPPYPRVYQGVRRRSLDRRVFKKDFDYAAVDQAHKIMCESLVHCVITHVAIETAEGIPTILRGGVGYRHFSIVVRAKPGDPLQGTIRVYCNKDPNDPGDLNTRTDD